MFTRFRLFLSPDAVDSGSDIDSMLADLLGEETDSPVEEPSVEAEEPAQEEAAPAAEPGEQPAGEDKGEEKSESEPAEAEVVEVVEPAATDSTVDEIASLRKQLEEMANKLALANQQKPVEVAPSEADKLREQKAADVKPVAEAKSFLSEDEYEDAFKSAEGMNKALNKVYQATTSDVIVRLANIVPQMVQQQVTINGLVTDFYRANEDLVPHKPYVGYVTQQLTSAHPDWEYPQLFKEVEKEVRKNLAKAKAQEARKVSPAPKIPSPSGRTPALPASRVSQIEKDMLDLLADDE